MIDRFNITNEELSELPKNQFNGEIIIIENAADAENAADYLSQFNELGFDTETRPSFKKGQVNKVALLQLSTDEKAFLFRLNRFHLPVKVFRLLSNPEIAKAGVAIRDDIKALQSINRFFPKGFVELQDIAKTKGLDCFSLKKLSGLVLGFRISKAQQLSNWEAENLTEPQQRYAATDAWVSYKIYKSFNNGFHA